MKCNGSYRVQDGKQTKVVKCGERKKWNCREHSTRTGSTETYDTCKYVPLMIDTT